MPPGYAQVWVCGRKWSASREEGAGPSSLSAQALLRPLGVPPTLAPAVLIPRGQLNARFRVGSERRGRRTNSADRAPGRLPPIQRKSWNGGDGDSGGALSVTPLHLSTPPPKKKKPTAQCLETLRTTDGQHSVTATP